MMSEFLDDNSSQIWEDDTLNYLETENYNQGLILTDQEIKNFRTPNQDLESSFEPASEDYMDYACNRLMMVVPDFDDSVSKTALRDFISKLTESEMSFEDEARATRFVLNAKKYPPHWISSIVSQLSKDKGDRDLFKRMSELTVMQNRRKKGSFATYAEVKKSKSSNNNVYAPTSVQKGNKRVAEIWRVPWYRVKEFPAKPEPFLVKGSSGRLEVRGFSPAAFRRWGRGECTRLSSQLRRKSQFISGNHAAETLWYMTRFNGRQHDLLPLMASARFYVEDHSQEERRQGLIRARTNGFVVHGHFIETLDQLHDWAPLFVRDKPLFRTMCKHYSDLMRTGKSSIEVPRVQRTIDLKFNLAPEVEIASVPDYAREGSPIVVSEPEQRHYLNALSKPWFPKGYEGFKIIPDKDPIPFERRLELAGLAPVVMNEYQGINHSKPVILEHHVNRDSVAEAANTLMGSVATSAVNKFLRPTVQVASFLVNFFASTSWQQMIAALMQFVSGNDLAWTYCFSRIQLTSTQYQGDGVFESIAKTGMDFLSEGLSHLWEALVGAGIFSLVQMAMREAADYVCEPIKDLIMHARLAVNRRMGMSIAESVIDAIKSILHRLNLCWTTKSLAPLWGEQWDPSIWETYVTSYIEYHQLLTVGPSYNSHAMKAIPELVTAGKLPDFWIEPVSLHLYVQRCDELRVQGEKLASYYRSDRIACEAIVRRLSQFATFFNPLRSKVVGVGMRVQPFLLYGYGLPGGGKTTLFRQLLKAMQVKYGYSENGIFEWRNNENFQSGLDHTIWAVDMDDIDTSVAPPAAGVPNHVESLIALVNNNPYKVEEAGVNEKGKVIAAPLIVMYKSNFEDARASKSILKPAAFWRRIRMHVTFSAKDEFGVNGVLNPDLAEMSTTWDMFNIDVRYFDPHNNVEENVHTIALTPPTRVSFTQFVDLFYKEYEAWLASQRKLVAACSHGSNVCKVCSFPLHKICGHPQEDSGYEGAALTVLSDSASAVFRFTGGFGLGYAVTQGVDWVSGRAISNAMKRMASPEFWLAAGATLAAAGAIYTLLDKSVSVVQGRLVNSVEGLVPFNWFRAEQEYVPGVQPAQFSASYTKDDLVRNIRKCMLQVEGVANGKSLFGHGLMVSQNCLIFPTHFAPSLGDMLHVTCGGRTLTSQLTVFNRRLLENPEMTLVKIPGLMGGFTLAPFLWMSVDKQVVSFDEVEIVLPESVKTTKRNKIVHSQKNSYMQTDGVTIKGDCGAPYIARIGDSWRIVAVHYLFTTITGFLGSIDHSIGALVSKLELDRTSELLASDMQGVSTEPLLMSKKGSADFTHYPSKSEVWAAVSHHDATPYPFGLIHPPMSGSTMKTKLQTSMLEPLCRDLAEKWTGKSKYWRFPEFRGAMIDGKWTSPFTAVFDTENNVKPDEATLWMAVADYLYEMDRLDGSGYAELSEEQILTGIPGSYIHRINVQTSVGPPYNQSKRMHVAFGDSGTYLSPEVWAIYDRIMEPLGASIRLFAPAAVGLCTLKDEPLREGKSPRVFIVLSFAFNMVLKKKGSPWKCFMRANFDYFESCVGVNMTGIDAHKLVEGLRVLDPDLTHSYTFDAKRLDKSYSGDLYDAVGYVIYAICWFIGVDAYGNLSLLRGLKHARYSIKNDFFSVFWNPSGCDWTVDLNGIITSIVERYLYYRGRDLPVDKLVGYMENFFLNPIPSSDFLCDFRKKFVLRTYGDDELMHTLQTIRPDYFVLCEREIGIIKTDAQKGGSEITMTHISKSQFLKRTFRWHEDTERWVGCLDLKSMARMLVMKKESTLSQPDHACIAMTECLREAVYYGRAFYEELQAFFLEVSKSLNLEQGGYLRLPTYDYYIEQVLAGTFQTWVDRSLLLTFVAADCILEYDHSFDR